MTPTATCSPGCARDSMNVRVAWSSRISRPMSITIIASACPSAAFGAKRSIRILPTTAAVTSATPAASRHCRAMAMNLISPFRRWLRSSSYPKADWMRLSAGTPTRLGASWDGWGTNFALFSANAEKIELCLFDTQGRRELERIELPERSEDIWHGYLNDVAPGQLYGYRVHGPYAPERGHRFNPNKLLLDPYARRLAGRLVWSDAHFGFRVGSSREDLSFDRRDNSRGMLKAVVVDELFHSRRQARPNVPWEDTIIYEAHVKGLTQLREDVPPQL